MKFGIPVVQFSEVQRDDYSQRGIINTLPQDSEDIPRIEVNESVISTGLDRVSVVKYTADSRDYHTFAVVDPEFRTIAYDGSSEIEDVPMDILFAAHAAGYKVRNAGQPGPGFDDLMAVKSIQHLLHGGYDSYGDYPIIEGLFRHINSTLTSLIALFTLRWQLPEDEILRIIDDLEGTAKTIRGREIYNERELRSLLWDELEQRGIPEKMFVEYEGIDYPLKEAPFFNRVGINLSYFGVGGDDYVAVDMLIEYGVRRNLFRDIGGRFIFERSKDTYERPNYLAVVELERVSGKPVDNVLEIGEQHPITKRYAAAHSIADTLENRFPPDSAGGYLLVDLWEMLGPLTGFLTAIETIGAEEVEALCAQIAEQADLDVEMLTPEEYQEIFAALLKLQSDETRDELYRKLEAIPEPTEVQYDHQNNSM